MLMVIAPPHLFGAIVVRHQTQSPLLEFATLSRRHPRYGDPISVALEDIATINVGALRK